MSRPPFFACPENASGCTPLNNSRSVLCLIRLPPRLARSRRNGTRRDAGDRLFLLFSDYASAP
jgi:hypothetical protein